MQLSTGNNRLLMKGNNEVYVTVSELNPYNNPIYSFIIKDETTMVFKNITVTDSSINAIRYNQFKIEVVDNIINENLPNAIAYLNTGKHTYQILSADPAYPATQSVCEVGIIKVLKDSTSPGTSYTSGLSQTYTSYTGNISQNI